MYEGFPSHTQTLWHDRYTFHQAPFEITDREFFQACLKSPQWIRSCFSFHGRSSHAPLSLSGYLFSILEVISICIHWDLLTYLYKSNSPFVLQFDNFISVCSGTASCRQIWVMILQSHHLTAAPWCLLLSCPLFLRRWMCGITGCCDLRQVWIVFVFVEVHWSVTELRIDSDFKDR